MEIADNMPLMNRQCLGRLFRVGQSPVLVFSPPTVEERIANSIQKKILSLKGNTLKDGDIFFGSATTATGLSLHPFQKRVAKKLRRRLDRMGKTDTLSM